MPIALGGLCARAEIEAADIGRYTGGKLSLMSVYCLTRSKSAGAFDIYPRFRCVPLPARAMRASTDVRGFYEIFILSAAVCKHENWTTMCPRAVLLLPETAGKK